MSEYQELHNLIEKQGAKIDRVLGYLEGDDKLGIPAVHEQISGNRTEVEELKKKVYQNEKNIVSQRKAAAGIGAGTGGVVTGLIEIIKNLIT